MNDLKSKEVERFLAKPDIHQQWVSAYRTAENEPFFEQAFDYIARVLNAPKNSTFLDAGCGTCAHSIRLANLGFLVQAVDLSESVLKEAEANVKAKGLETKISIRREDICSLSFEDETFSYILCWGVLMHIPDLEAAISELTRVLKPGGALVIGENNMYSLEAIILRSLKRFLRKEKASVKKTPAGMEYWTTTSAGTLLVREANTQWMIERFKSRGLTVKKHVARQFTELYLRFCSPLLKSLIHGFNNFWFKYIKIPHPALGSLVILQKEE
jgi:2-polyprenyl-3-methyl-5-hydroxy-6-metoxy-1,4-benzoquinol methylase